jgi:hypothetical protein
MRDAPTEPQWCVDRFNQQCLGHETFETITDPDGTAWIAVTSLGMFGEEIGDLCPGVSLTQPYFEDPISVINGKKYEVQPMYSNKYHACSYAP